MAENSDIIEVLNDLVMINNDRVAGYEKVLSETKEIENDLKSMFSNLADQSRGFAQDLSNEVTKLGGEPATGTLTSGKLYRVWMDVRSAFTTDNRKAVLENAESGEDAAKTAYAEAVKAELPDDIMQMLIKQQTSILTAHDTIKRDRDRQRDVSNYPLTS